jgi:hypothetical protein
VCFAEAFAFDHVEPERGDFGEEGSFAWEESWEDDIERGKAIGGDEEECRFVEGTCGELIDITDFAGDSSGKPKVGGADGAGCGVESHGRFYPVEGVLSCAGWLINGKSDRLIGSPRDYEHRTVASGDGLLR